MSCCGLIRATKHFSKSLKILFEFLNRRMYSLAPSGLAPVSLSLRGRRCPLAMLPPFRRASSKRFPALNSLNRLSCKVSRSVWRDSFRFSLPRLAEVQRTEWTIHCGDGFRNALRGCKPEFAFHATARGVPTRCVEMSEAFQQVDSVGVMRLHSNSARLCVPRVTTHCACHAVDLFKKRP